ncbi:MAG: transporter ATP-binding protein [Gemmataceae bacterium]|nr:transporter ATP-binding protein [Gemmataceae bacterium]
MITSRLGHTVRLGLRSLAAHRLRSGLTMLGIVLGVGSVIVMLAVGEAARYQALKQLEDLGASTIVLRSVKPAEEPSQRQGTDLLAYGLTYLDLDRIRATIPTLTAATPMREYRKTVRYLDRKTEARVVGVSPDFLRLHNIRLAAGRGIDALDEDGFTNVAVLGSAAAETLFPTEDPVGRSVSLEGADRLRSFTVVGVIAPKTLASGGGGGETDFNRVVFIPFATDRVRIGRELMTMKAGSFSVERLEISQVTVTVRDVADVPRTARALQSLIDQYHPRKDVTVTVPLDLLRKAEETQQLFTLILGSIAGVSLLVGGIGIANIMLATVTERTREIGIRRALGAKRKDIAVQFLAETLLLACCGGVIGVAFGVGVAYVVSGLIGLPTIIRVWSPAVAFGVSVLVGLASGLYPARRAARLDPIEALRHV